MRRQLLFFSVVFLLVTLADSRPLGSAPVDHQNPASLTSFDNAPAIIINAGSGDGADDNDLAPPLARRQFHGLAPSVLHAAFLPDARDTAARTPPARAPPRIS